MNKQNIPVSPDENKIEELLVKIQPIPSERFHQKMKQATWRTENIERQIKGKSNLRRRFAVALTVLLLLSGFLISPQGRAWAQEVFQFFQTVNFTSFPASKEEQGWMTVNEQYDLPLVPVIIPTLAPEMAAIRGCQTPQEAQTYTCQIAYAESILGFELKEFPQAPRGFGFWSVRLDDLSKTAIIGYGQDGWALRLTQGLGKPIDQYLAWYRVPVDKVETIKVGSFDGEYVNGNFVLPVNGDKWVWQDHVKMDQHLAWSDGIRWFLLEAYTAPGMSGYLNRSQLIKLAASVVDSPIAHTEKLSPDSLSSISEAEKYSGLDLKAPTLLPLGYRFSYARYLSFNKEVHLRYEGNGNLVIYEWEGKSIDFNSLANTSYKNYEIVKVNDEPAFFGSTEGSSPYSFLWWRKDGLNYKMYFYRYEGISGVLDKEKMIAIAESMQDVNDFRNRTLQSHEYLKIYEDALGLDIREFPNTPDGWSYTGVWADAWAQCINLSYTSTKFQGLLSVHQCTTDKYFLTDIPFNAIERVKIGQSTGEYIIGAYDNDETGNLKWKLDAPVRTLRWKENGRWIQISLHRDSVILYDKEDLISYEESLR